MLIFDSIYLCRLGCLWTHNPAALSSRARITSRHHHSKGEFNIFTFFNTVWASSLSDMSYKYPLPAAYLRTVFNRVFLGQKCLILNSTFQCFLFCVLCFWWPVKEYMAGECGGTCLESSGGKGRNIITLNLSLRNTKTLFQKWTMTPKDRAVFLIWDHNNFLLEVFFFCSYRFLVYFYLWNEVIYVHFHVLAFQDIWYYHNLYCNFTNESLSEKKKPQEIEYC